MFQGESHQELDRKTSLRNSKDEKLELTFSTLKETGLLVWKGQKDTDGEDYMMISLREGRPHVEDLGGRQMMVSLGQKVGAVPGVRMSGENSQFTNRTFSALIITRTSISIFWLKTWALLMRTNTLRENRIKTCLV